MNFSATLRALQRRWYVVVVGVLLGAVAAFGAWTHTPIQYERSASQLLLPGVGSLPSKTANPYLYLGGLAQAADVIVRVAASENSVAEVVRDYPGTVVTVTRDPSSSGPVIVITATSPSDADANAVVHAMVDRTTEVLQRVQAEEGIAARDRMTMTTLTIDNQPMLIQRTRLVATAGVAAVVVLISLLAASLIDGLVMRRRALKAAAAEILNQPESKPDPRSPQSDPTDAEGSERWSSHPKLALAAGSAVRDREKTATETGRWRR